MDLSHALLALISIACISNFLAIALTLARRVSLALVTGRCPAEYAVLLLNDELENVDPGEVNLAFIPEAIG